MTDAHDIIVELMERIRADIQAFEGAMPDDFVFAWHGYLTALDDWHVVDDNPSWRDAWRLLPALDPSHPFSGCAGYKVRSSVDEELVQARLRDCLQAEVNRFEGHFPEAHTLLWHGYLAGLFEWGVIRTPVAYQDLQRLLPRRSHPDPIRTILLGRISADELLPHLERDIVVCGGRLSERYAIAWKAYLAALMECYAIAPSVYHGLLTRVPRIPDPDPVELVSLSNGHILPELKRDIGMELEQRIKGSLASVSSAYRERYAIAWKAYLRGFAEWEVIDVGILERLIRLLPPIANPEPTPTKI